MFVIAAIFRSLDSSFQTRFSLDETYNENQALIYDSIFVIYIK